MDDKIARITVFFTILFILCHFYAYAKPMPSPTKEEAVRSSVIVVAEYTGRRPYWKTNYFVGPIAQYKVVRVLKGSDALDAINVRYDFHDGSACLPERGWKFTESLMPKKGSLWIIFLSGKDAGMGCFVTYRGDFGRWSATQEKISEVEKAISLLK